MNFLKILALALVAATAAIGFAQSDYVVDQAWMSHVQAGMAEQDVFVARDGSAFRMPADALADGTPLYAAAEPVEHNPGDPTDLGPFPLGEPLDATQATWLAGEGDVSLTCAGGLGELSASFRQLMPNAVYTVWHSLVATPLTVPFKALDIPVGPLDGSANEFRTDASGAAEFHLELDACMQLSHPNVTSALAIAYHSDGRTYGLEPGDFGLNSHIHLVTFLPPAE